MKLRLITETSAFSGKDDLVANIALFRQWKGQVEVLLERRARPPGAGQWTLPGGHIKPGEQPQMGALRELAEETGIKLNYLVPVRKTPSPPDRGLADYLFGAVIDPHTKYKASSDARSLEWCNIGRLPTMALNHQALVYDAAARVLGSSAPMHEGLLLGALNLLCEDSDKDARALVQQLLRRKPNSEPGLLIVFEGIDGAGKTMTAERIKEWIEQLGYEVVQSKWNSSKLLQKAIKKAKDSRTISPLLYSLLHAADMVVRYEEDILPALAENKIVICDRYIYTSMARDQVRGIDVGVLKKLYKDFRKPDILLHCSVPIHSAFTRLINRGSLSYYGSGMDLHLADNREDNYIKYAGLVDKAYNEILPGMPNYRKVRMDRTPDAIVAHVKELLRDKFGLGKYEDN